MGNRRKCLGNCRYISHTASDACMSKTANNLKPVIAVVAIIVLAVSWMWILGSKQDSTAPQRYFYDIEAEEMFVADTAIMPPITAPSGGEAVVALVYACGNCSDENGRFIAFFEKYTDAYKEALDRFRNDGIPLSEQVELEGHLIRTPDTADWLPMQSNEGVALWDKTLQGRCDKGVPLISCAP